MIADHINPLTPKSVKNQNSNVIFFLTLKNKKYHAKVLPKRFHLNGHTIEIYRQTQKLEIH